MTLTDRQNKSNRFKYIESLGKPKQLKITKNQIKSHRVVAGWTKTLDM